ncbi:universal stress protein UspE [Haemophilus influenzae]|uniref:Universal stress protein UspE n=1 Tax=Haemophilus influenzae TaxID=727 RepID=A0A2X1RG02_HAEIF|nr:universal stress protein UspE [Haemophilus influenzae]
MSALLSSEERSEMHQQVIEKHRHAVQYYLDKYANPKLNYNLILCGIAMKLMQLTKK